MRDNMWINLYEIDLRKPIISTTAMLVLAAVIFIGMIIFLVKTRDKQSPGLVKGARVILTIWFILFLFISTTWVYADNENYEMIVGTYKNGDFSVVEGIVDNYKENCDADQAHNDDEFFEVENVEFSYREPDRWGYHTIRKNGGVITGNGQHLKLSYVYVEGSSAYEEGRNVILRIDEYKEK